MLTLLRTFLTDDAGATAVEYAVLGMMIALTMIAGVATYFGTMQDLYDTNMDTLAVALTGS